MGVLGSDPTPFQKFDVLILAILELGEGIYEECMQLT